MAWESSQTCITLKSLQNTPAAGEAAVVAIGGVSKLYIGTTGSLVAGSIVVSEAAGAGILTNGSAAALAIALEDSTANGDIISVVVTGANGNIQ